MNTPRPGMVGIEYHSIHSGVAMANLRSSRLFGQVRTLFTAGTVTGLSDAQLLDQFALRSASAAEDTLAAEAAFEVLVARHGPMVLGVCRCALPTRTRLKTHFKPHS